MAVFLALGAVRAQQVAEVKPAPVAESAATMVLPEDFTWLGSGGIFSSAGFRDNVLLSHAGEERSGFLRAGFDATAMRVPGPRVDFDATLSAKGTRYFSAKTLDHEEEVIALSTWSYRLSEACKFSLNGAGTYFHMINDVSDSTAQKVLNEIKVLGVSVGPRVRWTWRDRYWLETRGSVGRDTFHGGYQNRRSGEGTVQAGWRPGKRFELSIAGFALRRDYDTREQPSVSGRELAGTLLGVRENGGEVRVKATLDRAAHWTSDTRASVGRFSDNGSGYLDYRDQRIAHELEWTGGDWLVQQETSARRIEYGVQTIGFGIAPPPRVRDSYLARLRVERKLGPRWTVYAEYSWERNRSNDEIASYAMNEGLLGIRWNWEK